MKTDLYQKVTDTIVASWRRGSGLGSSRGTPSTRPARITRPLRANGIPYRGINVLMLWSEAVEQRL